MHIEELHEINFLENIVTATLFNENELIVLMHNGEVLRYFLKTQKKETLVTIAIEKAGSNEKFDINAPSTIYVLNDIIVIANDYKTHVFVFFSTQKASFYLQRKDYYADISKYPIALFNNERGTPHLIYGVAWNHLQIMNLETKEIVTLSKSQFEENAAEKYKAFCKEFGLPEQAREDSAFDYFFGALKISPDKKYFLSKGWSWGSCDSYKVFEINHFINRPEILTLNIGDWEHLNRAACWIDEQTVAFGYNPFAEEDNAANFVIGSEIHLCNFMNKSLEHNIIKAEGLDTINAKMAFSKRFQTIVLCSKTSGVAAVSLDGKILLHNSEIKPTDYIYDLDLFITIRDKKIIIDQLIA